MNIVVLSLSSAAPGRVAADVAVRRTAELRAELLALYIVDARSVGGIERRVLGDGFVGERPCAELLKAAHDEWSRCAAEALAEVAEAAEAAGVPCRTRVEEGDYIAKVAAVLAASGAALCIAQDTGGSRLRRLLHVDDLTRLRAKAGCPVEAA